MGEGEKEKEESTRYESELFRRVAYAVDSGDVLRKRAADRALWRAGYEVRLSDEVILELMNPMRESCERKKDDSAYTNYCAVDDAMPAALLDRITSLFATRRLREDYWSAHHYGSVGFFSYSFDVCQRACDARTCLEQFAHVMLEVVAAHCPRLLSHPDAIEGKGDEDTAAHERTPRACSWRAEMWAHRRRVGPHCGHQFHFDSADEGRGGIIRNPAFSSILFLSSGDSGSDAGDDASYDHNDSDTNAMMSPTLITDMARADEGKLSTVETKDGEGRSDGGVLAYPRAGRIVAFRGDLLHGVLPVPLIDRETSQYRVTVMLAFWRQEADERDRVHRNAKRARVEDPTRTEPLDASEIRAAMPLPAIPSTTHRDNDNSTPWTSELRPANITNQSNVPLCSQSMRRAGFVPIRRVWTHIATDRGPVTQLPPYNSVFQGQ